MAKILKQYHTRLIKGFSQAITYAAGRNINQCNLFKYLILISYLQKCQFSVC